MENKWSEREASELAERCGARWGADLALRTYSSRLLGSEEGLVLHGGGNTSVKSTHTDLLGESVPAVFVKASGCDMSRAEPADHPGMALEPLRKLRALPELSDDAMLGELRARLFHFQSPTPSIEALVHAFLPPKYIDHAHPDAILALTNQSGGEKILRDALGKDVIVLGYVRAGFELAKKAAAAFEKNPKAAGMVWMHHGIVTWGETARESYDAMISLVTRAEKYLAKHAAPSFKTSTSLETAQERLSEAAPILRGLLARPLKNPDRPYRRVILRPLLDREILSLVDSERGKEIALSPPLTPDHLIFTKALPLWIDAPAYGDPGALKKQLSKAVAGYAEEYDSYMARNAKRTKKEISRFDSLPRVVLLPGLGALCAGGDSSEAAIASDITARTLAAKSRIAAMGSYQGLSEESLFDMEYNSFQRAKLASREEELPLSGHVGLVTGAAGAIGSGVCRGLLKEGCHVAATDISGSALDGLVDELRAKFGDRVIGVPLDVTDPDSVSQGVEAVVRTWGGVDLAVVNAGAAAVASLAEMDVEKFRKLERVNVEGTLLVLRELARHFELQGTGGDVILVSTKNVFAPGAKFGAYSATKAAAHQLGRIASLELAPIGVRVNMVAPDAVFADGARKSGLWREVGPDRMRARGLDEKDLEEHYRNRNLLKARITADHVANAVLFFATRQTPTTGATLPVDGGLPDATPR
jgi:rhamnose utilization protein RhaD (predicted bifunctional aldolase and dehydrogenase)/NAD(P)-dependent dehydrogenase (short-subunit alcohol dehydrogenase family)